MAVTAQEIYTEVCDALLEDGGLQFVYTQAGFLSDLRVAVDTFLQSAGIVMTVGAVAITGAGEDTYSIPDDAVQVEAVFANGRHLHRGSTFHMDNADARWDAYGQDTPNEWRVDSIDVRKVQVIPPPIAAGTLTVIATAQGGVTSIALGDTIPMVPDLFTPYLKYYCLQKIWETEGESRDLARADYCRARWDEGLMIAAAIAGEDLQRGA